MNKAHIINRLRDDNEYYNGLGKEFLSNSDIITLLQTPDLFGIPQTKTVNLQIGGYFHALVLEPHKLEKYKVIEATTRNTKVYKELSEGEVCLLQHEVDLIEGWRDKVLANPFVKNLIIGDNVEYEVPNIGEIEGVMWKGKADIVNHDNQLVIDLKTTGEMDRFRWSADKYNYDSQAYIYQTLFGYDMVFVVIDKKTSRLGFYQVSDKFLQSGALKVAKAVQVYNELIKDPDTFKKEYIHEEIL